MITYKRGDTFAPTMSYQTDQGVPASLVGYEVTSQVRNGRFGIVETLVVEVTNAAGGLFTIEPVDTSDWPLGVVQWDIRYDLNGNVMHTETVDIRIKREVTEDLLQ